MLELWAPGKAHSEGAMDIQSAIRGSDVLWNHPSLFTTRGSRSSSDFMDQDPTEVAAFVSECKKSCSALADG